jgi:golgi phosphoprotein 3
LLTLFDKLIILSLHDEECTVLPSVAKRLELGVGGAILAELTLLGKVCVGSSGKLEVVDSSEVGDKVLDKALNHFQGFKQGRKVNYCVELLNGEFGKHQKKLVGRLVSESVLSRGENGLSWVMPYADSPNPNISAKYFIKSHLRELVLTRGEPELTDLALLDLAKSSKLLSLIFTKDERKTAQRWIYTLVMSKALNDPIVGSLQEIDVSIDSLMGNS